jgi:putative peptidoglycan lipid II flippase
LKDGSLSWLTYAFRLIQLPIGMFGVAIATVNTAYASRSAAEKNIEKLKENLSSSLKLNFFLTIPSTFGLFVLGTWIINVLFQHGKFTHFDTIQTYWAIVFYGIGLFAYASVKVLAPVYYALSLSKIPMFSSIMAVCANLIVSFSTYKWIGYKGLALGTSTAALSNFTFLMIVFYKKIGSLSQYKIFMSFMKIFLASLLMAVSLFFAIQKVNFNVSFLNQVIILGLFLLAGIGLYILFSFFFKVEEVHRFYIIIKNKLKK